MNETIEIKRSNVLASYEEARKAGANAYMQFLENLFGKELFAPKDVKERIKTFEDACRELGDEHPFVQAYTTWVLHEELDDQLDIIAYLKLRIICAALNEGWEPKFYENEERFNPLHFLHTYDELKKISDYEKKKRHMIGTYGYQTEFSGLSCGYSAASSSHSSTHFGSRLCLKTQALAEYCGNQFIDIWADFLLIRK